MLVDIRSAQTDKEIISFYQNLSKLMVQLVNSIPWWRNTNFPKSRERLREEEGKSGLPFEHRGEVEVQQAGNTPKEPKRVLRYSAKALEEPCRLSVPSGITVALRCLDSGSLNIDLSGSHQFPPNLNSEPTS